MGDSAHALEQRQGFSVAQVGVDDGQQDLSSAALVIENLPDVALPTPSRSSRSNRSRASSRPASTVRPNVPWSSKAAIVCTGIVLLVSGPNSCPALLGRAGPSRAGPCRPSSRNPDQISIASSPNASASRYLAAAPSQSRSGFAARSGQRRDRATMTRAFRSRLRPRSVGLNGALSRSYLARRVVGVLPDVCRTPQPTGPGGTQLGGTHDGPQHAPDRGRRDGGRHRCSAKWTR
jgi:hypothetical protein